MGPASGVWRFTSGTAPRGDRCASIVGRSLICYSAGGGEAMALYKKGKLWGIDYRFPPGRHGKRIRELIGTKDEALLVMAKRKEDIRQGRNPELRRIDPKPLKDMVAEYLEVHVKREGLDYKTAKQNTDILIAHFGNKTLQEIGPREIEDFIA